MAEAESFIATVLGLAAIQSLFHFSCIPKGYVIFSIPRDGFAVEQKALTMKDIFRTLTHHSSCLVHQWIGLYLRSLQCIILSMVSSANSRVNTVAALSIFLCTISFSAQADHSRRDKMTVLLPDGSSRIFDLHDLEKMEQTEFITSSPWTDGPNLFAGVPLIDFVQSIGVNVSSITITARNDYVVDFDLEDLTTDWPILASHMDGLPIPNRTMGPYWVIYPYDDVPDLRREDIYASSIWQVETIELK